MVVTPQKGGARKDFNLSLLTQVEGLERCKDDNWFWCKQKVASRYYIYRIRSTSEVNVEGSTYDSPTSSKRDVSQAIGKNMKKKGQNICSQNLVCIISQPKVLGFPPNVLQWTSMVILSTKSSWCRKFRWWVPLGAGTCTRCCEQKTPGSAVETDRCVGVNAPTRIIVRTQIIKWMTLRKVR